MVKKDSIILKPLGCFNFPQYKSKSINIAKRFGVSGDDPDDDNDDDDADVDVAVNEHRKRRCIVRRKRTNLRGIR